MKHSFDSITLKKSSFTKTINDNNLKSNQNPRKESFCEMIHISVAPLFRVIFCHELSEKKFYKFHLYFRYSILFVHFGSLIHTRS